jgi:hypothetical protein
VYLEGRFSVKIRPITDAPKFPGGDKFGGHFSPEYENVIIKSM